MKHFQLSSMCQSFILLTGLLVQLGPSAAFDLASTSIFVGRSAAPTSTTRTSRVARTTIEPRTALAFAPLHVPSTFSNRAVETTKSSSSQLHSALSSVFASVDTFWRQFPYVAAALTCGFKASAADIVAQRRQFRKRDTSSVPAIDGSKAEDATPQKTDLRRNLAYLIYGAIYQGMSQEFIYNHVYPVMFGSGTDVVTVLAKVSFDLLVQTTLLTLPIAYVSKAVIYKYSFKEAMRRYWDDFRNHGLLSKYFLLWGPVQSLTFSIVPEHFRVTFIALVSFFWLIILSSIASKPRVNGAQTAMGKDECLLEDAQTCNIDG